MNDEFEVVTPPRVKVSAVQGGRARLCALGRNPSTREGQCSELDWWNNHRMDVVTPPRVKVSAVVGIVGELKIMCRNPSTREGQCS